MSIDIFQMLNIQIHFRQVFERHFCYINTFVLLK
uniref:Uncharacterized protein n=1 Tax=viral metagenome TaxID=1070528 RepID=A0A6C0EGZ9_9ZZZZ